MTKLEKIIQATRGVINTLALSAVVLIVPYSIMSSYSEAGKDVHADITLAYKDNKS